MIYEIQLQTEKRDDMLDITAQVEKILVQENVQDGLIVVYSPHTTAGITINENADPDVQKDILRRLDEIYPRDNDKDRHGEGNSAAHLKASTVGHPKLSLFIKGNYFLAAGRVFIFVNLMVLVRVAVF